MPLSVIICGLKLFQFQANDTNDVILWRITIKQLYIIILITTVRLSTANA